MATLNGSGFSIGKFFGVFVCAMLVVFLGWVGIQMLGNSSDTQLNTGGQTVEQTLRGGFTEQDVLTHTIELTDNEWNDWMNNTNSQFNLDVYIRDSHAAAQHGTDEMNAALRTCTQYGTISVISSNLFRRLTLLCEDPTTKKQYAVIIEQIKRSVDSFKNSYSELVTAFEFHAGDPYPNIAAYINNEVNIAKSGILVRLAFRAGELFFAPYR